jgi:DNA repair protein RecN (Recombination protein N)
MIAGATITGSALEHAGALIAAARAPAPERARRTASPRAAARQIAARSR